MMWTKTKAWFTKNELFKKELLLLVIVITSVSLLLMERFELAFNDVAHTYISAPEGHKEMVERNLELPY